MFPLPYPAPGNIVSPLALLPPTSNTSLSTTYVFSGKRNFGPIILESENSHEHSEPNVNSGSNISVSTADASSSSRAVNHANSSGSIFMSTAGPSSSRVINLIMVNPKGYPFNDQSELDAHVILYHRLAKIQFVIVLLQLKCKIL
uniref:Uncharacterized protein n=1 Tax=Populus alba TaxID=43335 RepID=A0A4U5NNZ6_POPAL|nr:hypothetical protein D5086_0000255390 [Populus alba]